MSDDSHLWTATLDRAAQHSLTRVSHSPQLSRDGHAYIHTIWMQDNTPDFFEPVGGPLFSDWLIYPMHCGRLIQWKYRLYICMAFLNFLPLTTSVDLNPCCHFVCDPALLPVCYFPARFVCEICLGRLPSPDSNGNPRSRGSQPVHSHAGSRSIFPSYFRSYYNFHSVSPSFPVYIYIKKRVKERRSRVFVAGG